MDLEYTLSILKPDVLKRNIIGKVVSCFEEHGLEIIAQKMVFFSREEAIKFYEEHSHQKFFNDLIDYMTSSPVIVQVLKGKNAISKNRDLMGATNPKDAAPGTIRHKFGINIQSNTVHGSDSPENAKREISLLFTKKEIFDK